MTYESREEKMAALCRGKDRKKRDEREGERGKNLLKQLYRGNQPLPLVAGTGSRLE